MLASLLRIILLTATLKILERGLDKGPIIIHGNYHDVTHPSYQAYSYKHFLCDMSTAVYEKNLHPYSCAYLHNYKVSKKEPLLDKQYAEFYTDTPMFFQNDASKLERYFYEHVGQGNGKGIADDFEDSKQQFTAFKPLAHRPKPRLARL